MGQGTSLLASEGPQALPAAWCSQGCVFTSSSALWVEASVLAGIAAPKSAGETALQHVTAMSRMQICCRDLNLTKAPFFAPVRANSHICFVLLGADLSATNAKCGLYVMPFSLNLSRLYLLNHYSFNWIIHYNIFQAIKVTYENFLWRSVLEM